jgi:hypothetical protein
LSPNFERFLCRVPLGPLKIKNRSKNGLNVAQQSNLTNYDSFSSSRWKSTKQHIN